MITEKQMQEVGEKAVAKICEIYDPEVPVNIYELGLIYDIKVSDEACSFSINP